LDDKSSGIDSILTQDRGKPCSQDLRGRVLEGVETGASRREAGERFAVSRSSTIKWIQCWQETGSIAAKLSGESISAQEKRGTRSSAPRDRCTASTYIFGAVCPERGNGAALILLACNTETMNLHLAEIAETVAPGSHAVLLIRLAALDSRRQQSWDAHIRDQRGQP
jgi:transposase-like protein